MFSSIKNKILSKNDNTDSDKSYGISLEENPHKWLLRWIEHRMPMCRLRINHNRVTMLSLRYATSGTESQIIASIHADILSQPQAVAEIPAWITSRGHKVGPHLQKTFDTVFKRQRADELIIKRAAFPALPAPIQPLDLIGALDHVHGTWFDFLPKPVIKWGRDPGNRSLSSIRFGCYVRRPKPLITLHPRLKRPVIPWIFIEHVLFHELCHHRQACEPIAHEPHHSRRFQQWERTYPHHELATEWQRLFLDSVLQEHSVFKF